MSLASIALIKKGTTKFWTFNGGGVFFFYDRSLFSKFGTYFYETYPTAALVVLRTDHIN